MLILGCISNAGPNNTIGRSISL